MMKQKLFARWNKIAADMLVGRKITKVSYMDAKETEALGWCRRAVVIELDDGNLIFPSADDEGNGPGALFTNDDKNPILPVL